MPDWCKGFFFFFLKILLSTGRIYQGWEGGCSKSVGWFGDGLNITSSSCLIRAFLQAGKHVCVEYPMALSYRAALDLWDLATEKGRTTRMRLLWRDMLGCVDQYSSCHNAQYEHYFSSYIYITTQVTLCISHCACVCQD